MEPSGARSQMAAANSDDVWPESEEIAAVNSDCTTDVSQEAVEASRVVLVAEDDVAHDSVQASRLDSGAVDVADRVVLAADDVGLDSTAVDVAELELLAAVRLDSVEAPWVLLAEDNVAQDSITVPDSVEAPLVLHAEVDIVPDSMEMVPESLPPGAFVCGRCELVHEDREAWNIAHSRFYPCPHCGVVHADYAIAAMLGRINVHCEIFMEHYKGLLPPKE